MNMTPGLAVAKTVVTLPPLILTLTAIAPILAPLIAHHILGAQSSVLEVRWQGALSFAIGIGWLWSIYIVSTAALADAPPRWIRWTFFTPPLLDAFTPFFLGTPANGALGLLVMTTFGFCLFQTVGALEAADPGPKPASTGRILSILLVCFFMPVGVWVLRQRLLRVAARTA